MCKCWPISWREQVTFSWDDEDVHFIQDQHTDFDFLVLNSVKQQSMGRHVASHNILMTLFLVTPLYCVFIEKQHITML
jgi:hypothetical protein